MYLHFVTIAYIIFQKANADTDAMCEWDLMVWKVKRFDVGKRPEIICAKGWILLWKRTRYLMQTDVTKTSVLGRLR